MLLKGGREEGTEEGKKEEKKEGWAEMLDHCKAFWEGLSTRGSGSASSKEHALFAWTCLEFCTHPSQVRGAPLITGLSELGLL